ncbi:chemotaxis protein CheW [Pontibacillus halophilus JSM 076056 = DSM 19796]|uniref:Chemotaxis protein CheW n=1 Tax=Pontibacillus halophilus JSM 076056 = DSM 19796 TaxID=1385510 RepID=A0A0A5GIR2_9BACI|nr:chemotaxis protein CheW [Pontibacillus halophilus]KGX93151.1 chemotaxis protein CheW [Pontibacillus halophilus JSM 076056 = DSM 19796]
MTQSQMEETKVIVFQLKNEEYGVPVNQVGSIERVQHITRVPNSPDFVKGVINLRGIVTPVVDLRTRFGLEELEHQENTRMIIVQMDQMHVGLVVDAANDVIDIPQEAIEPAPEVVGSVEADYIKGVAKLEKRLLILLNLDKVFSNAEVKQLQSVEG